MASNSSVSSKFQKMKISDDKKSQDSILYPLRMTTDKRTEMYVKFAKVLLIFQGPVTVKRQQAVKQLSSTFIYASRIVSDKSYVKETVSRFADYNVNDFYTYFRSRVKTSVEEGTNLIVIDPSMTNIQQIKHYCYLAQKSQYLVLPYPALVDSDSSALSTVVNQAEVFKKFSRRPMVQPNYFKHLFCGWFLHDVDSVELRELACLYVQDCYEGINEFKEMFTKIICKSCDFPSFYNMVEKRQDLAFCTVKIFDNLLNDKYYMSEEAFLKSYGKMSRLFIVGFIISPHMIAARVKLTYEQRKLWDMNDDLEEKNQPLIYPTELLKSSKVDMPGVDVRLIASKSNRTIITGDPIFEPLKAIDDKARGRSCHILLGKVNNAPPRNADYDTAFAVFRDRVVSKKYAAEVRPYDLQRCLVRRIGKYWLVYLKETLIVNGLFATCCSIQDGTE